ncbi:TPA_asm: P [Baccharis alphacytorhabdovirus 1]|nr:TPA_asm: P [Baccharis alphacytorhabdovirus 1]
MDSADFTPDFSSVDTGVLRSPNAFTSVHDDMGTHEYDQNFVYVPETSDDSPKVDNKNSSVNHKAVVTLLTDAFAKVGLAVTDHCITTAVALAHSNPLEPSSMDWFAAGIVYANNSLIIEKMAALVKDMQAEMRSLQVASTTVKDTTIEFVSKMNKNKNEIVEEMTKTKESVLKATREITTYLVPEPAIEEEVDLSGREEPIVQREGKAPELDKVNPVLLNPGLSKPVSHKTPEELVVERKRNILVDMGVDIDEVADLSDESIEVLIDDETLLRVEGGISQQELDEIFDQVIGLLMDN